MDELTKSIDSLIEDLFAEPVSKAGENFEVANASKTTADAAIAAAPKMEKDSARGAGRPDQISDVPENDEDGKRAKEYDASIAKDQAAEANPEAAKQAKVVDQMSSAGRMGEKPSMKDPRLSKSDYEELEAFRKSKAESESKAEELRKSEELKKADDLRKAELETLVKSAIASAIKPLQLENQELKKSLSQSEVLIKAMAGQPQRSKSVTGIEALEKSAPESNGPQEFTKADKLNAAESLVMKKALPMEAVIELSSTGTVYNPEWRKRIEQELMKENK
jgi:hypothetical protein